jgi:hypothetical protein
MSDGREKVLEGPVHDLIKAIFQNFPGGTEENRKTSG